MKDKIIYYEFEEGSFLRGDLTRPISSKGRFD
jgi:hypothetical protein